MATKKKNKWGIIPDDVAEINERMTLLKNYTKDEEILQKVDHVVFEQDELEEVFLNHKDLIYLCEKEYHIPPNMKNTQFILIGGATINNPSNCIMEKVNEVEETTTDISYDAKYEVGKVVKLMLEWIDDNEIEWEDELDSFIKADEIDGMEFENYGEEEYIYSTEKKAEKALLKAINVARKKSIEAYNQKITDLMDDALERIGYVNDLAKEYLQDFVIDINSEISDLEQEDAIDFLNQAIEKYFSKEVLELLEMRKELSKYMEKVFKDNLAKEFKDSAYYFEYCEIDSDDDAESYAFLIEDGIEEMKDAVNFAEENSIDEIEKYVYKRVEQKINEFIKEMKYRVKAIEKIVS